jgi:hypothetical protein
MHVLRPDKVVCTCFLPKAFTWSFLYVFDSYFHPYTDSGSVQNGGT